MRPFAAGPIRTERMTLRPLTEHDLDDVYAYQAIADVIRYLPWPERTRDEAAEHLALRSGWTSVETDGDRLVLAMEFEGRVIGDLTFILTSVTDAQVEIGWVLHPDFHGRGLATEGARELLRVAFDEVGAHRVSARLDPRNVASAALCTRLGMRLEARFVEDTLFKGEWSDTAIYGLLAREYRSPAG